METYIIRVNGVEYEVEVEKKGNAGQMQATTQFISQSQNVNPANAGNSNQNVNPANAAGSSKDPSTGKKLTAGVAGKVWKIVLKEGSKVAKGEAVVVIEAMKMEIPVVSPIAGTVTGITVAEGDGIEAGQVVATVI